MDFCQICVYNQKANKSQTTKEKISNQLSYMKIIWLYTPRK